LDSRFADSPAEDGSADLADCTRYVGHFGLGAYAEDDRCRRGAPAASVSRLNSLGATSRELQARSDDRKARVTTPLSRSSSSTASSRVRIRRCTHQIPAAWTSVRLKPRHDRWRLRAAQTRNCRTSVMGNRSSAPWRLLLSVDRQPGGYRDSFGHGKVAVLSVSWVVWTRMIRRLMSYPAEPSPDYRELTSAC
jgi:hypothetical protein